MKPCEHCKNPINKGVTGKYQACYFTVVGIKYLMHYACALEVKRKAQKEIEYLNVIYS